MKKAEKNSSLPSAFLIVKGCLIISLLLPLPGFIGYFIFLLFGAVSLLFGIGALVFLSINDASRWARRSGFSIDSIILLSWGNILLSIVAFVFLFLVALAFSASYRF